MKTEIRKRLDKGNENYRRTSSEDLRLRTAKEGQNPYAIVICCSDSRVIPEQIFSAGIGDLFVIRVAGNVLDNHQLGSIEYAASHLDCDQIIVLGHTGCGAVSAALSGHADGFVRFITEDIQEAVGEERDPDKACRLNVLHAMDRLARDFALHPEIDKVEISGAVYDIVSGNVEWIG
ncbi:MAG: carbonic anhydrase [Eubacterium sp.]|nr:carbonic anhydrase [Eubacterium sp.]